MLTLQSHFDYILHITIPTQTFRPTLTISPVEHSLRHGAIIIARVHVIVDSGVATEDIHARIEWRQNHGLSVDWGQLVEEVAEVLLVEGHGTTLADLYSG